MVTTDNIAEKFEKNIKGLPENTRLAYKRDVAGFLDWCEQKKHMHITLRLLKRKPHSLSQALFQQYINSLGKKKRPASILRKIVSLRIFIEFLQAKRFIAHDPLSNLSLPNKGLSKPPRGLNDKERAAFEAEFQKRWPGNYSIEDARNLSVRNRSIALTMIYVGTHVDEIRTLNLANLQLGRNSGILRIGKRETSIPLPARKALRSWLKTRKQLGFSEKKRAPLFVRLTREPGKRLSVRSIQDMVVEVGRRAQISGPVSPQVLRHTCGYLLYRTGVQAKVIAKMLGVSVATAEKYSGAKEGKIDLFDIKEAASRLDHLEAS